MASMRCGHRRETRLDGPSFGEFAQRCSMRCSRDDEVGVKCRRHQARFGSANHLATGEALWAERLSSTTSTMRSFDTCRSLTLENANTLLAIVRAPGVGEDLTGSDVHGREEVGRVVPLLVVGRRPAPSDRHRERGLRAVQPFDLGLFRRNGTPRRAVGNPYRARLRRPPSPRSCFDVPVTRPRVPSHP